MGILLNNFIHFLFPSLMDEFTVFKFALSVIVQ